MNTQPQNKNDKEKKDLLDAYDRILEVWKVQNENYFKRVQVFMAVLQAGLFIAVLKLLHPLPSHWFQPLLSAVLVTLGILSTLLWKKLHDKQRQYLEFTRRNLRNIESRIAILGSPLGYFTAESAVFSKYWNIQPDLKGVKIGSYQDNHIAEFEWSKEKYPGLRGEDDEIHTVGKVKGGMISFEKALARGVLWLWIILLVLILVIGAFNVCNGNSKESKTKIEIKKE